MNFFLYEKSSKTLLMKKDYVEPFPTAVEQHRKMFPTLGRLSRREPRVTIMELSGSLRLKVKCASHTAPSEKKGLGVCAENEGVGKTASHEHEAQRGQDARLRFVETLHWFSGPLYGTAVVSGRDLQDMHKLREKSVFPKKLTKASIQGGKDGATRVRQIEKYLKKK